MKSVKYCAFCFYAPVSCHGFQVSPAAADVSDGVDHAAVQRTETVQS